METSTLKSVVFGGGQGSGYIALNDYDIKEIAKPQDVIVNFERLIPGNHTTLSGFFNTSVQFIGIINKSEMIFLLGSDTDLFETRYYYESVLRCTDKRIFCMYSWSGGRDWNFKNGNWK